MTTATAIEILRARAGFTWHGPHGGLGHPALGILGHFTDASLCAAAQALLDAGPLDPHAALVVASEPLVPR